MHLNKHIKETMKKTYLLLFILIIISCNNDDEPLIKEKIDSYHFMFMHYPGSIMTNSDTDNLVHIQYKNNKIIRRDGGLISANPSSGFNYVFTDIIYDDVTYSSNELTIELKTYSLENISKFNRTLKLDNQSRIVQRIIEKETGYGTEIDTIDFEYNSNGKLIKSSSRKLVYPKESFYYYNSIENLDSIVTKEYLFNPNIGLLSLRKKIIETFENYDDSTNPTKNLIIFEETFYRSLSKNNYSKYKKEVFNAEGELIEDGYRIWELVYDENGMIQFNL